MRVVYLHKALRDMAWVRQYYGNIFPEGARKARAQLQNTEKIIVLSPYIGHPSEKVDDAREHHIPRTPFTFLYRLRDDRIEIMRVIDTRADLTVTKSAS